MLLSIIIPTFNSVKTLADCLNSVINQTFQNFEVWIIDGMSTDGTIQIIKQYQEKYYFVNYISEKDAGIYDAMNKGITLAKGEWLYFLGSDDELFNIKVLECIFTRFFKELSTSDIIYGNVIFTEDMIMSTNHKRFHSSEFLFNNINHQSIFYRKQVFNIIGNYNISYQIFADWELNIRAFFNENVSCKYIDIIVAYFSILGASSNKIDPFIEKKKIYNPLSYQEKAFSF